MAEMGPHHRQLIPSFRDAPLAWAWFYLLAFESVTEIIRHTPQALVFGDYPHGLCFLVMAAPYAYAVAALAWRLYRGVIQRNEVTRCERHMAALAVLFGAGVICALTSSSVAWICWERAQALRPPPYNPRTATLYYEALRTWHRGLLAFVLPDVVRAGFCAVVAIAMIPLWRRANRNLRRARGRCELCDYNLTGNVSGVCPECGTPCEQQTASPP
jgi:hypothetical protein